MAKSRNTTNRTSTPSANRNKTTSRKKAAKAKSPDPKPEKQEKSTSRQTGKQPVTARQGSPTPPSPPQRPVVKPVVETKQEAVKQVFEEKPNIILDQSVAILIDGNNIEMSLHSVSGKKGAMINFDKLVPALLQNRALSRLIYFREGKSISQKLAERLQKMFHGSVVPCYKSADIPLSIKAVQVASKVDTIIILSGDADYVELVRHLKHDGIRVEIAAFPETTADVLRNESDYFFPITVDYSFVLK